MPISSRPMSRSTSRRARGIARGAGAMGLVGLLVLGGCSSTDEGSEAAGPEGTVEAPPATVAEAQTPARVDRADRVDREGEAARRFDEGRRLAEAGDLQSALAELERAIAINPSLTPAYIAAGDIYRERRDLPRAEERYRRATEIDPSNFDALSRHALVLQLMGRLDDAVRGYLRALAIRPDDFDANLNTGAAYARLGEPRQALIYAARAVELNPQSGAARINLGAVYAALDRHADAVIEYQQAAELVDEPTPKLLVSLADSLGQTGRYAEMVATLDQLVARTPTPEAYERLGAGLFRLRRYDRSLEAFERAVEMDAQHYPALNGVSVCLLNRYLWSEGDDRAALDRAVETLRASLRVKANQPKIVELVRRYGPRAGAGLDS